MSKYEFDYCKECGNKLSFEEEHDTCTSCKKHKQFIDGKMPSTGDIFLMTMRKYDD
jgi:hypothetical protein